MKNTRHRFFFSQGVPAGELESVLFTLQSLAVETLPLLREAKNESAERVKNVELRLKNLRAAADIVEQMQKFDAEMRTDDDAKAYREYARANMQKDGEVDIDEDAEVYTSDRYNAYVQAWVPVQRCDVPELQNESSCRECGGACQIDEDGISNHIDADGNIDHDTDADHVAVMDGREE